jgi:Sortase domain
MTTPTLQEAKNYWFQTITQSLGAGIPFHKNQHNNKEDSYLYRVKKLQTNPFQSFLNNRYRIFVILMVIISTPVLYASTSNTPQTIDAIGYEKTISNFLFSRISKSGFGASENSIGQLAQSISKNTNHFPFLNKSSNQAISYTNIQGIITSEIQNSKNKSIADLIPAPANPQLTNFLRYPKYGINVPIQYAGLKDLFETDKNGELVKASDGRFVPIEENVERDGPLGVPVQRLLINGIVHIGFTPQPGDVGNSYIVGHSSNFSSVPSDYNYIFRPLQERSQIGEEFFVYDKDGRELKFNVFEVKTIKQEETNIAYFGGSESEDLYSKTGKRVVTLQCSILEYVKGTLQPTKRWLTRGELVL